MTQGCASIKTPGCGSITLHFSVHFSVHVSVHFVKLLTKVWMFRSIVQSIFWVQNYAIESPPGWPYSPPLLALKAYPLSEPDFLPEREKEREGAILKCARSPYQSPISSQKGRWMDGRWKRSKCGRASFSFTGASKGQATRESILLHAGGRDIFTPVSEPL